MTFLFTILLFILLILIGGTWVISLLGQGIWGILKLFGLGGEKRVQDHQTSWKDDATQNSDDNKLEIRTEDGLKRMKKMKDSAETIEFEEADEVKIGQEQ